MKRQHAWKIVSAAALILGVVVLLVAPASAQDTTGGNTGPTRTITVTGNGTAYGTPDVGNVDVGVETSNQDFETAFNSANDAMTKVLAALGDAGIDAKDMQTSGINVWWENPNNPQTGTPSDTRLYHVSESLHIVVRDITQVGAVITTAVNNGANNVYNLSFGLSDTTALEGQARASAIDDARARAEDLANLLGVTLGDPISVVESPSGSTPPTPFAASDVRMASAQSVPVQPGQLSVSDQVQVVFAIGQ